MRWTKGMAVMAVMALGGCHDVEQDRARSTNAIADAADRAAASLDLPDNASDRVDAATARAERIANRAAAIAVPAGSSFVTDTWVGRWTGVEGLNLVIAKDRGHGPGHYTLTMQYSLDDKGVFAGVADGEAIRFTRPDGDRELYAARGDETGLKWLAGKRDCLMVRKGEGYCRG